MTSNATAITQDLDVIVKDIFPRWLIHPDSNFKIVWSLVIMALLIYTATAMPYRMAFIEAEIWSDWFIAELIIDLLFLTDVVVNWFSAYWNEDSKLITSRRYILCKYASGWMLLDIIASIPFGLVEAFEVQEDGGPRKYNSFIRLFRVPRLYRLMRISRIFKLLKNSRHDSLVVKIQEFFALRQSVVRLTQVAITITVIAHVVACIWVFLAKLNEPGDPETWISSYGIQDDSNGAVYIDSLYWAFTTMSTVGYGDILPVNAAEKIFALLIMVFGVCFFSYIIGNMASMLQRQDSKEAVLNDKMAIIDEFAQESQLDPDLKRRLRRALTYSTEKNGFSWADKQQLFNELPRDLKYEVAMVMHKGACQEIGFFANRDVVFIYTVVPFLQYQFVVWHTIIYTEDEHADEIYFIHKGRINCVYKHRDMEEESVYKQYQRGSYFGVIEVVKRIPRKYRTRAAWDSDLLIMSKQLFSQIEIEFTGIAKEMKEVGKVRDKLNTASIRRIKQQLNSSRSRKATEIPCSTPELNTPVNEDYRSSVANMQVTLNNFEKDIKNLKRRMDEMQDSVLQKIDYKFADLKTELVQLLANQAPIVNIKSERLPYEIPSVDIQSEVYQTNQSIDQFEEDETSPFQIVVSGTNYKEESETDQPEADAAYVYSDVY